MVCFSSVRTTSAVMFLMLLGGMAGLFTGISGSAAAEPNEVLWTHPSTYVQGDQVALELAVEPVHPVTSPLQFVYQVNCDMGFENANAVFRILDEGGSAVHEMLATYNLKSGENKCSFEWDPMASPPGAYKAVLSVYYGSQMPPVTCTTPLERVSSAAMDAAVARFEGQLTETAARVDALAETPDGCPYLRVRLALAGEVLAAVRANLSEAKWAEAYRGLAYVHQAMQTLNAGLVFSKSSPEMMPPLARMSGRVSVQGASLTADGAPVTLLGCVLDLTKADAPGRLARMASLGMNFAVLPLDDAETVTAAPFDDAVMRAVLDPILDVAAAKGVAVVVQLSQVALGHAIQGQVADIQAPGFVPLSHPALRAALERHVKAVGDAVAGRESVMGISLAETPAFKFDGEPVREQFISRMRAQYPDRQDLNQIWRAHMADYDEITIWGDNPPHAYQNQRAYQFDWQSFHTQLVDEALSGLRAAAGPACPGLSIMVTLPDTAFEKGETKYAPDRELAARLMDVNACAVSAGSAAKPPYAIEYPRAVIHYALQRSYSPQKPVLNLSAGINPAENLDLQRCYGTVRTLLWEALISGASGLAIAPDSPVYARPEALEALVVTALDARRLAGIVRAFAEAPADVQVFFSGSSKIMDNGEPHLQSAYYAFEGSSFSGYNVRFVTERDIANGALDKSKVLIMPETPAATDAAFKKIDEFVAGGGAVARVGTPIPYNERGKSRADVIRTTAKTVFVEGMNMPTEYLHTMDTTVVRAVLPPIARPTNTFGYPLEGVHTRYAVIDGVSYLYVVNLRPTPVSCQLSGGMSAGRDLIQGREVSFPRVLVPLEPMLIRLDAVVHDAAAR
jgi:hypothetical protein